ncbi:site-specific integrase [Pseudomonas putida]|uniref:site-specific integrase n=1 Tax=Pseudomonas putida TaxID=303 RepID=UPI001E2CFA14|nr:site-specific integrase [Pseudomonas putida]MCE0974754.1 site-specific integrase [Pseudomonas putida]
MSYENSHHHGRLVLMAHLPNAFAELYITQEPRGAFEVVLEGTQPPQFLYQVNELGAKAGEGDLFHFPFLFHKDYKPWFEANSYLLDFVRHKPLAGRPTDDVRRRASKLLDYLIFCEDKGLNWLDFSGKRPALRPTYKYFAHLISDGKRNAAVINQYTGVVFSFYKFVAENWHDIDIERVDTVKQVKFMLRGDFGNRLISAEKRSQTKSTPASSPVPIGFIREDGEDLRPLANTELSELLNVLRGKDWSVQERLILMTALMTGARKQTVLTLRLRHLKLFTEDRLQRDGTYLLHAGPGTGLDTKRDRGQRLYVPKQLADELKVLANSPMAIKRRKKLRRHFETRYPDLSPLVDDDMYVFLSDQGGCYYMAKDDPRYPMVKSKPTGQVTENMRRKFLAKTSDKFPNDFTYHWLRATYAFQLYQHLLPLLESGHMRPGEEISFIQVRLHHKNRETTERYLKLFKMHSCKLAAQESYEGKLFNFGSYDDLRLENSDE